MSLQEKNKTRVLEAFEAAFNRRDPKAFETYWSPAYLQHSAHIPQGREGLSGLVAALPPTVKYENQLIVAEGDYVLLHGRFSGLGGPSWVVVDIVKIIDGVLVEHWDVIQDEATKAQSKSGLPMFGNSFPEEAT